MPLIFYKIRGEKPHNTISEQLPKFILRRKYNNKNKLINIADIEEKEDL